MLKVLILTTSTSYLLKIHPHWHFYQEISESSQSHFNGLVQDSNNSIINILELVQLCAKPSAFVVTGWERFCPGAYMYDFAYIQYLDLDVIVDGISQQPGLRIHKKDVYA